jgi:predicted peptidase
MKTFLFLAIFISFTFCAIAQSPGYYKLPAPADPQTAQQRKSAINSISADVFTAGYFKGIPYRLLSPAVTVKGKRYPLVLILHSSGGVGTDNTQQLGVLAKYWAQPQIQAAFPAYVVAPQFPDRTSNYKQGPGGVQASVPSAALPEAMLLVDSLKKILPIDENSIYVLGFSMGGSSVINSIGRRPGLFAAAVAISGIPDFGHTTALSKVPLWIIHGNADTENPFASDSLLYHQLNKKQLTFWEIDKLQHEIFSDLYTTNILPEWLFRHHLHKQ